MSSFPVSLNTANKCEAEDAQILHDDFSDSKFSRDAADDDGVSVEEMVGSSQVVDQDCKSERADISVTSSFQTASPGAMASFDAELSDAETEVMSRKASIDVSSISDARYAPIITTNGRRTRSRTSRIVPNSSMNQSPVKTNQRAPSRIVPVSYGIPTYPSHEPHPLTYPHSVNYGPPPMMAAPVSDPSALQSSQMPYFGGLPPQSYAPMPDPSASYGLMPGPMMEYWPTTGYPMAQPYCGVEGQPRLSSTQQLQLCFGEDTAQ